jgi:hypothetical protein
MADDMLNEVRLDIKQVLINQASTAEKLKDILGNGKAGRLDNVERTVFKHDKILTKSFGWAVGFLAAMELLHVLLEMGLKSVIK